MATTTANVAPNNATDAEFRAWAQFVHDVFANGSWVQTADTGQINLTTVTRPLATNTKQGYEVWRMDDSHQTAAPVFLKLAYGSGSGSANQPGLWFMVGTATDGAGNLIDTNDASRPAWLLDYYSQTAAPISSRSNSATTHDCFGSATTDRAVFVLFEAKPTLQYTGSQCEFVNITGPDTASPGNFISAFSIERARDINGATIADFLYVRWTTTGTNGWFGAEQYVSTSNAVMVHNFLWGTVSAKPATGAGTALIPIYAESATLPTGAAAYGIIPFQQSTRPSWPGINVITSNHPIMSFTLPGGNCTVPFNATYNTGRTAAASPYGTARTYRTVAGVRSAQFGAGNRDDGGYLWILFE